eukprot:SAG31_NODE_11403_length_1035_cov_0.685897_1_plen_47_part_10
MGDQFLTNCRAGVLQYVVVEIYCGLSTFVINVAKNNGEAAAQLKFED